MSFQIRPAIHNDLPAIVALYNEAIVKKGLTADLEPLNIKDRQEWFEEHAEKEFPLLVAEENNIVVDGFHLILIVKEEKHCKQLLK